MLKLFVVIGFILALHVLVYPGPLLDCKKWNTCTAKTTSRQLIHAQ